MRKLPDLGYRLIATAGRGNLFQILSNPNFLLTLDTLIEPFTPMGKKRKLNSGMAKVLIIDDDQSLCKMLSQFITKMDGTPRYALTLKEGLEILESDSFDAVFLDVGLPDGNGLDFIPEIKANASSPEVVIITGQGERDGAELAINNGAWDYLNKPFSISRITLQLSGILKYREEKKSREKPVLLNREEIIGESQELKRCLTLLIDAAESDANVLITGETGTGKELFARAIHQNSQRSKKNFVVVDCGALTESLVGSILFGHQKGAFTGAEKSHDGLIKQADGGTLFMDEAGELPMSIQAAFLRVLQEKSVRPLGSSKEVPSDFRLVTATNRNLEELVRKGDMRKDLLYRLQTITIELPPLRNRKGDIKDLVIHYINKFCEQYQYESKGFSREFMEMMQSYDWPGNVRELANAVEKAVCSARKDDLLYPIHLPSSIRVQSTFKTLKPQETKPVPQNQNTVRNQPNSFIDFKTYIRESEQQYLLDLFSATRGNISEMCRISGISRSRLYERLKSYRIKQK